MSDLNILPKMRYLILNCISSTSYNIIWNGDKTDSFKLSRGLRHGDPLSPYLFILCLEKLSQLIEESLEAGNWRTLRAGRSWPIISHLFFVDDIILFGEASERQLDYMMNCLNIFCHATRQKVSMEKTRIFFSKGVDADMRDNIINKSGFTHTNDLGTYLGMPLLHGRQTNRGFSHILDRVNSVNT